MTRIDGTPGNDRLLGSSADEEILGYAGDDFIDGGAWRSGVDIISGGDGDDTIQTLESGRRGDEAETQDQEWAQVDGGEGNDAIRLTNPRYVNVSGGQGNDKLILDFSEHGVAQYDDSLISGHIVRLEISGFEVIEIIGSGETDSISYGYFGDGVDYRIFGGGGGDYIYTGSGNDYIDAGYGGDVIGTVEAGGGDDFLTGAGRLYGETGNDTYGPGSNAVEFADQGIDTLQSIVSLVLPEHFENLTLLGSSEINGTGNAASNVIIGNNAANVLSGGGFGEDRLEGLGGRDTYQVNSAGDVVVERSGGGLDTVRSNINYTLPAFVENLVLLGSPTTGIGNSLSNVITGNSKDNLLEGRQGNDTLYGGPGSDRMVGGYGDDIYHVHSNGDRVVEYASAGTDTVFSIIDFTLGTHVENLTLTRTTSINGTGNNRNNTIVGNDAANTLVGRGGADTLTGGSGNDKLYGGAGHDYLAGGPGSDGYYFDSPLNASSNVDQIRGFRRADDTIFLDRDIFKAITANGTLAPGAFRPGTSAGDVDDRIVYDKNSGNIFYDADGSGNAGAILFAQVSPGTILTNADFVAYF